MKERPILFSGPMVRAILEGRKTQTRRVVSQKHLPLLKDLLGGFFDSKWNQRPMPYGQGPQTLTTRPTYAGWVDVQWEPGDDWQRVWLFDGGETWGWHPGDDPESVFLDCRPELTKWRSPGDSLWVRETWCDSMNDNFIGEQRHPVCKQMGAIYKATFDGWPYTWKPSIFMPRWASRLTLEVVSVRVERLQKITHDDAVAEGFYRIDSCEEYPNGNAWGRLGFSQLWDSINAKRGYGWESNPWVWVIEFKKLEQPK